MSPARFFRSFAPALVGLALAAGSAVAADRPVPDATVPVAACDSWLVLHRVRGDFAGASAAVEKTDLSIADFGTVHEQGASVNAPSPIARRWCYAPVTLSDGSTSTAYWRIDAGVGFAGPGLLGIHDRIESCVLGHDRWKTHDGLCRTVRLWW